MRMDQIKDAERRLPGTFPALLFKRGCGAHFKHIERQPGRRGLTAALPGLQTEDQVTKLRAWASRPCWAHGRGAWPV